MLGETRSGLNLWGRIRRTPKKRGGSPRRYGVQVQTGRVPSTEALRAAAQASE